MKANIRLVVSNLPRQSSSPEAGSARQQDPLTSRIAAGSVNATNLELLVYNYLFRRGEDLTAFEIARGLRMDIRSISPRLKPLKRKGFVTETGTKLCLNDAGNMRPMITWRAEP